MLCFYWVILDEFALRALQVKYSFGNFAKTKIYHKVILDLWSDNILCNTVTVHVNNVYLSL